MPRFFFNHRSSNGTDEIDIDGLKLTSLNDALAEATFAAQGAIALAATATEGVFEIEDEGWVVVARVPYGASEADDPLETPHPE
jgi:hypothetical protein